MITVDPTSPIVITRNDLYGAVPIVPGSRNAIEDMIIIDKSSAYATHWYSIVGLLWSSFCQTWITVAWAMLIGRE